MRFPATSCLALACLLFCCAPLAADVPTVAYIFPAGGQRGREVEVRVGGHYLHDACAWEMTGPGVTVPAELQRAADVVWFEGPLIPLPESQQKEDYPWEHQATLQIAGDAPLGLRRWRVWTSQGVTSTRKFVVGDLPEVVEEEIDGDPIPTAVTLPVTVNGRIFPREDVDIWSFAARAGGSYVCEVMAARLGSPLDARLAVYGPGGRLIAENEDGIGADSYLRFTAPRDGTYQVRIHDVDFGGLQHYVYRLTITDGPRVERVFPLGGRRGTTVAFQLFGQGVPDHPQSIALPELPAAAPGSELALTRPTISLDSHPYLLPAIEVSDVAEELEAEPNDEAAEATTVSLPVVLNGRIDAAGDVDGWKLPAAQGDKLQFEVRAARLASPLDAVLELYDADGKQLASADDLGKGQTDARLTFTAPADGVYRIVIKDRFARRGGSEFAYRLHAGPLAEESAGFELQLPADAVTVNRGGETKIKVTAVRRGGFSGPIEIKAAGLPPSVTLSGNTIAEKKNDTQLVFKAAADAPVQVVKLQIAGQAQLGEQTIERAAQLPLESFDDVPSELMLAVAMATPYKVFGEFETKYAERGATYLRHFKIDRGSYQGPITVRLAERQVRHLQGVTGPTIVVPAGQSEFDFPIKLAPWMEVGRTSRTCVMAVAQVADESGRQHTVSYTSHEQNDQVIVLVDPGQLDVKLDRHSLRATPGAAAEVMVRVARGKGLSGPVQVECLVPAHVRGVTSEPLRLEHDQSAGALQLRFSAARPGPFNMPLLVRATTTRDGQPYTAETKLTLVE